MNFRMPDHARSDLPAALVVFLVAVPPCLGEAAVPIPRLLTLIPLATLAAVLPTVGHTLAKPTLFAQMFRHGWAQFAPLVVTVVGILTTDLLVGIGLGMAVAVFRLLLTNYRNPYYLDPRVHKPGEPVRLVLSEDVSFLNRAAILRTLEALPPGTRVEIDASRSVHIDHHVFEILREYAQTAAVRGIDVTMIGLDAAADRTDAIRDVGRVIRRELKRVARQGVLVESPSQ